MEMIAELSGDMKRIEYSKMRDAIKVEDCSLLFVASVSSSYRLFISSMVVLSCSEPLVEVKPTIDPEEEHNCDVKKPSPKTNVQEK